MNNSEPEDENEVDDDTERTDNREAFLFDWSRERFPKKTTLMFFAISFAPARPVDLVQLRIPKHDKTKTSLYVAGFFVKEGSEWYVYRKALIVTRKVTAAELPAIYRKLERNAYSQLPGSRRRKYHPLEYISIVL